MSPKRHYPPPARGPGGRALTKRQKAEGIAKWAELLTQGKHAKAGAPAPPQTPGKTPSGAPQGKIDPLFDGSELPGKAPKKGKKLAGSAGKAKAAGRKPKAGSRKAPVSIDTKAPPAGVTVDLTARPASEPPERPPPASQAAAASVSDPLTSRQLRFVEEYLVDLNAAGAARRAGYSKASARTTGPENLSKPAIQEAIAAKRLSLATRIQVTPEDITDELRKMAFANVADFHHITADGDPYIDLSDCTRDQLAALSEIKVKEYVEGRGEDSRQVKETGIKLNDKRASLSLLSDLLGYSPKRAVNVSGTLKVEKAEDSLATTIRRMETTDLRRYNELATEQEQLLAKARGGAAAVS